MKKVAIVGFAPTRVDAPWDDDSYDIWVVNELASSPKIDTERWDICFQLHPDWDFSKSLNFSDPGHWDWLQQDHGPDKVIMMQEKYHQIPNAKKFPLDDILDKFGQSSRYFTSSISYMIAYAAFLEYDLIEIYGIIMAGNTEYYHQKPCVEYWIGRAEGAGCKVVLADDSPILGGNVRLYGYESKPRINRMHLEAFHSAATKRASGSKHQALIALEEVERLSTRLQSTIRPKTRIEIQDEIDRVMTALLKHNYTAGFWEGQVEAIRRITNELDDVSNPNDRIVTYGEID